MFSNKSLRFKGLILVIITVIIVSMNLYPMIEPGSEKYNARFPDSSNPVKDDRSKNFEVDSRALPDTVDVPTIVQGDTWTYHTELNVAGRVTFGLFNIDLVGTITGDTTFTADKITTKVVNGTDFMCYRIDFTGTFLLDTTGMGGIIRITFDAVTIGSEYWCVSDLSIIKRDTFRNGTISIQSPYGNDEFEFNLTTNETYKQPEENYDFPIYPGEEWTQSLLLYADNTGDFGGNPINDSSVTPMGNIYRCNETEQTDVDAGNFDTFVIDVNEGANKKFYSGEVRNIVLDEVGAGTFIDTPEATITIESGSIELTDYDVNEYGNILQINEIPATAPNSTITVSGNIPGISTGNINIEIPGEEISVTAPISNGNFQKELYMDNRADNTPNLLSIDDYWSNITDIGSHGVIIYYGNFVVHKVITATIAEPDISVVDISFNPINGSLVGAPVNLNITVSNPSMVTVLNLEFRLEHEEVEIDPAFVITLPPLENITTTRVWTGIGPVGVHQFRCVLDPDQLINESREDNNEYTVEYNISDRPIPGILSASPDPGDISIDELDVINFNVTLEELPGGIYTKIWSFRMAHEENYTVIPGNSSSFQFVTHYLGNSSSINSPFKFKFLVNDEAALTDRSISLEWNVTVNNVNRPPTIENRLPVNAIIKMSENETLNLSIEGEDLDKTIPLTDWFLDNASLGVSTNFYQYKPDFNSSGFHNISVRLWDSESPGNISLSDHFVWNIEVTNKNRNCSAIIEYPLDGSIFKVGERINFSANGTCDPDILPMDYSSKLSFSWDFGDSKSAKGFKVNHSYLSKGPYSVELTVRDPEGGTDTYTITLDIVQPPADTDGDGIVDTEDPDIDGDGVLNDEDDYPYDKDRQKKPEKTPVEAERLSSFHIAVIFILGTGLIILIIVWSFLNIRQNKKKAEEEDAKNREGEELYTQVNNLVALEDEREVILERLDKIEGKFEQLDWDLEDGYIPKERYEHLKDRYRHRRNQLKDELAEIDDQIDYIERKIERTDRRRVSKKSTYGGAGSDDFERSSYQKVEEEFDDEGKRWDEDEYWAEESEEEPAPVKRRRYYDDYDEGYDKYSESEEDEYVDYDYDYDEEGDDDYREDDYEDDYDPEEDEDDYYRD